MKQIKIKELFIQNFKGINILEINLYEANEISGDNGVGKTTVYDAWRWLITGRDSSYRTTMEVQPVDNTGSRIKDLDTVVSAKVDIDGVEHSFSRKLAEKWVKKQNSPVREFSGMTSTYTVNMDTVTEKYYQAWIEDNISAHKRFMILSDPFFFSSDNMKDTNTADMERRKCLKALFSEKAEVPEDIKLILAGKTPEERIKDLSQKMNVVSSEVDSLTAKMDYIVKSINPNVDITKLDWLNSKLNNLKNIIKDPAENVAKISDIQSKISQLNEKIMAKRTEKMEADGKIKMIENEIYLSENKIGSMNSELSRLALDVKYNEDQRQQLRDEYAKTKNALVQVSNCPTCGQKYPEEKTKEIIRRLTEEKNSKLSSIVNSGKRLLESCDSMRKREISLKDEIVLETAHCAAIKQKLADYPISILDVSVETDMIDELNKEIKVLSTDTEMGSIGTEIQSVTDEINKIKNEQIKITERDKYDKLIKESLEKYNVLLSNINSLKDYSFKQSEDLEKSINKNFNIIRFRMFEKLVNGDIKECCITQVNTNGVWVDLVTNGNTAGKINAGLELISVLSEKIGVQLPVFIDNTESINKIISIKNQVVYLKVSKGPLTIKDGEL